ncbi:MAG TPA: hypothetical protein VKM35_05245 [Arenimonas sp.]|uniref:hypothetical protein n=1 Tax=Arenimonas sp. TaxID=1872635 RepID=UPI002BFB0FF9|nr:hypothetical protein [Arenimonas sp.]HMB56597.1 hypothetical protein [Arenimonas sp.]
MKCADSATGWTFDCLTDVSGQPQDGGLVLQKVRHDGHNFAKDIRTVGLWFEFEKFDALGQSQGVHKVLCPLAASQGFVVSPVRLLVPKTMAYPEVVQKIKGHAQTFKYLEESNTALLFSDYFRDGDNAVAFGVAAKYDGSLVLDSLVWELGFPPCEYSGFSVEQIFLFSRYSNVPAHEPSGALLAARFHPLIHYQLTKNTAYDPMLSRTRIRSIRFDYRLHLYLDSSHEFTEKPDAAQTRKRRSQGNQAGLFADRDSLGFWRSVTAPVRDMSTLAFAAVEKPLVLEVTAPGLFKGVSEGGDLAVPPPEGKVSCWDNIHWWGTRYAANTYISAPGAFHAAHCHWRWGELINNAGIIPGADYDYGFRHFLPGKPLVDLGIFMQTIKVAVTRLTSWRDPEQTPLAKLTTSEWADFFDGKHSFAAQPIDTGDDIVLWYSTEVASEVTIPSLGNTPFYAADSGTVFLHGIFFAHDAEKSGGAVGSTEAQYRPRSADEIKRAGKWFRPAG